MTNTTHTDPRTSLTAAFHAIFDAKDAAGPGTPTFHAAYEALQKLEVVMTEAGVPVPRRFDAPR